MASELECDWYSGRTVYFQIRNTVGEIYNTALTTFQPYQTANIGNYDIAAVEQGTASGYYTADMPALSIGAYSVIGKEQSGGSPAETDITIAVGDMQWSGTEAVSIASIKAKTDNLPTDPADQSLVETSINNAWNAIVNTIVGETNAIDNVIAGIDNVTDQLQAMIDFNIGANAYEFKTTALANAPTASQIATEILSSGDIDGFSLEETLKLCLSALAAKIAGAGTTTIVIRATDDSKPRITAEVDEFGNRTTVTLDAAG